MHSRHLSPGLRHCLLAGSVLLGVCHGSAWAQGGSVSAPLAPGVFSVQAPPANFDPISANADQLLQFGFPARPDGAQNPKGYLVWMRAMRATKMRIVPVLSTVHIMRAMGKAKSMRRVATASANGVEVDTITGTTWGGIALQNLALTAFGKKSFTKVAGEFNIPLAQVPFGAPCDGYSREADIWVGLDGLLLTHDDDVVQTGVSVSAFCSPTYGTQVSYTPWFEWWPGPPQGIANFPVTGGQVVFASITALSSTSAVAFLVNENTGTSMSIAFKPSSGTVAIGDAAEWIVEAPETGDYLPNYVATWFDGMQATIGQTTMAMNYPSSLGSVLVISTIDSNGNTVSLPTVEGTNGFVLHTENGAVSTPSAPANAVTAASKGVAPN